MVCPVIMDTDCFNQLSHWSQQTQTWLTIFLPVDLTDDLKLRSPINTSVTENIHGTRKKHRARQGTYDDLTRD